MTDRQAGWPTKEARDQETKPTHAVAIAAPNPKGAADATRVTIAATNAEEKGMAALLEMHPKLGGAATSNQPTRTGELRAQTGRGPGPAPRTGPHRNQRRDAADLHVGGE